MIKEAVGKGRVSTHAPTAHIKCIRRKKCKRMRPHMHVRPTPNSVFSHVAPATLHALVA
jgi:hypothetical protein